MPIIWYLLAHAFRFFLYDTGYLKLAISCKNIISFLSCSATHSCSFRHSFIHIPFFFVNIGDDLWWKTNFNVRWLCTENNLWWKTTFIGRQLLIKKFWDCALPYIAVAVIFWNTEIFQLGLSQVVIHLKLKKNIKFQFYWYHYNIPVHFLVILVANILLFLVKYPDLTILALSHFIKKIKIFC